MQPPSQTTPLLACDLTAIPAEHRAAHQALATALFSEAVAEIQELTDGYAFRFAPQHYPQLTQFIAHERLCCPFFTFTLELTPASGPIWLRLTGPAGAKAILQSELGLTGNAR
jgi:hypothetical protein